MWCASCLGCSHSRCYICVCVCLIFSLTHSLLSVSRSGGWFWENDGGGGDDDYEDYNDDDDVEWGWHGFMCAFTSAKEWGIFFFLSHSLTTVLCVLASNDVRALNNIENTNPDKTLKLMCSFWYFVGWGEKRVEKEEGEKKFGETIFFFIVDDDACWGENDTKQKELTQQCNLLIINSNIMKFHQIFYFNNFYWRSLLCGFLLFLTFYYTRKRRGRACVLWRS